MPKNKFQEVIFTIMMVFVMVYVMICYNIALNTGGLDSSVFLSAFRELVIMAPVAFILDFFFVGHMAKRAAFRIVDPRKENPFHLVLAISAVSVMWMCPLMSLAATILFKMQAVSLLPSGCRQQSSISRWHFSGRCAMQGRLYGSCSG